MSDFAEEKTDLHSSRIAISSDPYKQRRTRLIHNGTLKSFVCLSMNRVSHET